MAREPARQRRADDKLAERDRHTRTQGAACLPATTGKPGAGILRSMDEVAALAEEVLAISGEDDLAPAAVEQPDAQLGFQARHRLADCRRRDPEQAGGGGEAARLGSADKGGKAGKGVCAHL